MDNRERQDVLLDEADPAVRGRQRSAQRPRLVAGAVTCALAAVLVAVGLATRPGTSAVTMIGAAGAPDPAGSSTAASKATSTVAPAPTVPAAFCPAAVGYVKDLRRMAVSLTDPTQLRGLLQRASPAIAQTAAGAPAELKASVALLAGAISEYSVALDKAGYQLATVSPDMVTKLESPQVQDALNRVDSYVRRVCGSS